MPKYSVPPLPILPSVRVDRFAAPPGEHTGGSGQPILLPEEHSGIDALERRVIWISVTVAALTSVIATLLVLMIEQL